MTREVLFNVEARRGKRTQRKVDWHAPARANQVGLAQVMSTTIPLHQIGTSRTTPGILASDRNCFSRQRSCTKLKVSAVGIRLVACDTSNVARMLISECHCGMCLSCLAASGQEG